MNKLLKKRLDFLKKIDEKYLYDVISYLDFGCNLDTLTHDFIKDILNDNMEPEDFAERDRIAADLEIDLN